MHLKSDIRLIVHKHPVRSLLLYPMEDRNILCEKNTGCSGGSAPLYVRQSRCFVGPTGGAKSQLFKMATAVCSTCILYHYLTIGETQT